MADLQTELEELTPEYLKEVLLNPLESERLMYEKTAAGYRIAAPIPAELRPMPSGQDTVEIRVERNH